MAKGRKPQGKPLAEPAFPLRLPGPPGLWRWLVVVAAMMVVVAVLYPGAVFRGEIFGGSDAANADAFRLAGDRALGAGSYPQWNPFLFAGMPTFGSLAYTRFLYPPSFVFELVQDHLGGVPLTWLLGHLVFGGVGMAWLLSRWRLSLPVLILGGALWLLLPKVVAWGVHGHGSKLGAAMYLPWITGWVLRVLDGGGARAVGMVGLLLGLQLLRGHVQITYYTLLLNGWLAVWNAVWPLEAALRAAGAAVRWRRLALVAGGVALGFMVAAALLVPVHGYAKISIRGQDTAGGGGVGLDYATGWSLAPAELGTLVLPAAAGFGRATYQGLMPFTDYPNYLGVLLLLLAVAGWWAGARSLAAALGVASLLAVLVSFGRYGFGLYELLYAALPYFNKFRIPSMILILVGFAAVVLAARGVGALGAGSVPPGRPQVLPAVLGLLGLVMLLGGGASLMRDSYLAGLAALAAKAGKPAVPALLDEAWQLHRASLIRIGLVLAVAASALVFAGRNETFRRRGLVWVLFALLVVDLGGVDRLVIHPERGLLDVARDAQGKGRLVSAGKLTRQPLRRDGVAELGPDAAALVQLVGHERVWPLGSLGGANTWMVAGVRSLGGYHPAKLTVYEQIRRRLYGDPLAGRLANWLGGRIVAFDRPLGAQDLDYLAARGLDLEPTRSAGRGMHFYRNRAALPRARLVTAWRPVSALPRGDELEPFLDAVAAGRLAVADTVTLAVPPVPEPVTAAEPLSAPEFVHDGLNEVVLATDAPVPALLLLADMNAPGWRVEVDGERRPLLAADLVLRAVALEAGPHTVRFTYRDPSVRAGLGLSALGVLLTVALILTPNLRRRAAPHPGVEHE